MNVPAEVIPAEILVVFLAGFDEVIQRFHPEILRLAQFAAQLLVFDAAPQRPHGKNERQIRQFIPRRAEIENFVLVRRALKINRRITDD